MVLLHTTAACNQYYGNSDKLIDGFDTIVTPDFFYRPTPPRPAPKPPHEMYCPGNRLNAAHYSNAIGLANMPSQRWRFSIMFHSDGTNSEFGSQLYNVQDVANRLNSFFGADWHITNVYPVSYNPTASKLPTAFSNSKFVVQVNTTKKYTSSQLEAFVNDVFKQDSPRGFVRRFSNLPEPLRRSGTDKNHHLCRINAIDVSPLDPKTTASDTLDSGKHTATTPLFNLDETWHEAYTSASALHYFSSNVRVKILSDLKNSSTDDRAYNFFETNYASTDSVVGRILFEGIFKQLLRQTVKSRVLVYDGMSTYLPDGTETQYDAIEINKKFKGRREVKLPTDVMLIDPLGDFKDVGHEYTPFYKGQILKSYADFAEEIRKSDYIYKTEEITFPHMASVSAIITSNSTNPENPRLGMLGYYLQKRISVSQVSKFHPNVSSITGNQIYLPDDIYGSLIVNGLSFLEKKATSNCFLQALGCLASIAKKYAKPIATYPDVINISQDYATTKINQSDAIMNGKKCGGSTMNTLMATLGDKAPLLIKAAGNLSSDNAKRLQEIDTVDILGLSCPYVITVHGLNGTASAPLLRNVKISSDSFVGHIASITNPSYWSYYVGAPFYASVPTWFTYNSANKSWEINAPIGSGTSYSAPHVTALAALIAASWPVSQNYADYNRSPNEPAHKGRAMYAILRDSMGSNVPMTVGDVGSSGVHAYPFPVLNYECAANFLIQKIYQKKLEVSVSPDLKRLHSTLKRVGSSGAPQCMYQTLDSLQ